MLKDYRVMKVANRFQYIFITLAYNLLRQYVLLTEASELAIYLQLFFLNMWYSSHSQVQKENKFCS